MYDFALIGGGIVGMATAWRLIERLPQARLIVLEKEGALALHQSGRNSGVIHSGIYYRPGSLKARLAREGNRELVRFCRERSIPHEICGKIIVATRADELARLEELRQRAAANGIEVEWLCPARMKEREPHVAGRAALHVPSAGVVDYRRVVYELAREIRERGAEVRVNSEVQSLSERADEVVVETRGGEVRARFLINCAGLHADRLARLCGVDPGIRLIPFRGEYYALAPERRYLVRHLIYPVPDPSLPFLGVHFTRAIDGRVHVGPNAVLALAREGYAKVSFVWRDALEMFGDGGFWRMARRHVRTAAEEWWRSMSKRAFVRDAQRLVPELRAEDLMPAESGVRAQAVSADGRLVDDFHIVWGARSAHVCNAPSPAATASLAIARLIVDQLEERFKR